MSTELGVLKQRSENGAKLLDRLFPGWANRISAANLNMASVNKCVVGQLLGHYTNVGRNKLREMSAGLDENACGFLGSESADYRTLTWAWRVEITQRLST